MTKQSRKVGPNASEGGGGPKIRGTLKRAKSALLGTVALGAMALSYGRGAYAQAIILPNEVNSAGPCVVGLTDANEIRCTGDVAKGIDWHVNDVGVGTYGKTLVVEDIDGDIAPITGPGIIFVSGFRGQAYGGPLTAVIDTGDYVIRTTNGNGIDIRSDKGTNASIDLTHSGDISVVGGDGIFVNAARSTGAGFVVVRNTGDIEVSDSVSKTGIRALAINNQVSNAVTVYQTGDIYNRDGSGYSEAVYLKAVGANASIKMVSVGDFTTAPTPPNGAGNAIFAYANNTTPNTPDNPDAAIYIRHTGELTANGASEVLNARTNASGGGNIDIAVYGDIRQLNSNRQPAAVTAISGAYPSGGNPAAGGGDVKFRLIGDIEVSGEYDNPAIIARSRRAGSVEVYHRGDLKLTGGASRNGFQHAITAESGFSLRTDPVELQSILDEGWDMDVTVTHIGDITTGSADTAINEAIRALALGGDVTVYQSGNIITHGGISAGILASSSVAPGDVKVTQIGSITTTGDNSPGIFALTHSGGDVTVDVDSKIKTSAETSTGIHAAIIGEGSAFIKQRGEIDASGTGIGVWTSDHTDGEFGASLEIAGLVSSSTGRAIDLVRVKNATDGVAGEVEIPGGDVRVELQPGYGFAGIVDARNGDGELRGDNRLVLGGPAGEASFDLGSISSDDVADEGETFFGFANVFLKEDASTFLLTGENQVGAEFGEASITGGLALLSDDAVFRMAADAGPLVLKGGGFGAIGSGARFVGDLTLGAGGAIVLSNGAQAAQAANRSAARRVEAVPGMSSGLGGADDVLFVKGNFRGNGGAIHLDAFLDDGASGQSDQLIIGGSATGDAVVYVYNVGGPGGVTGDGPTDGIKIIDVLGDNNAEFTLGAPVEAGAYDYKLAQSAGLLQSTEDQTAGGGDPGDVVLVPSDVSNQAIAAAQTPFALQALGGQLMGSYAERAGNRIGWLADVPQTGEAFHDRIGPWTRVIGAWSDADGVVGAGPFTSGVEYDQSLWAIQTGLDAVVWSDGGDALLASAFVHYGKVDTSAERATGAAAGSSSADGIGGGAALTFVSKEGAYVDAVASYTNYDVDIATATGITGDTGADVWSLSAEVGWRLPVIENFSVTPQAQLIYQDASLSGYVDSAGSAVTFRNGESLVGRVGAVVDYQMVTEGSVARIYAEGSLTNEFADAPSAVLGGTLATLDGGGTGYEIGLGAQVADTGGGVSGWIEGSREASFSGGAETWSVTAGVRIRF